ncbi:MAG: nucleotidyl transferase AbiEii/AbiGii toxin family protein [Verrucomicrobia bacterium]|nr:nucleotidyl transferase AbiEii/AbiGii toxin family protein [Verrucomicrobiota bacterium]
MITKLPMGPYEEILCALAQSGVDFIVGGGVACVLHGVERVTMDVDVAVQMQADNFGKFIATMERLGLKPRVPIAPASLLDPETIKMIVQEKHALVFSFIDPDRPFRHVDIFLRDDLSYATLVDDVEWKELYGTRIRVISRRRLLAIKEAIQPPRTKDLIDIEWLRNNQP